MPFEIARAYWIYDVPGGAHRGGHAYRELEELVIALSGSFEVSVDDGVQRSSFTLNRGYVGLYIPRATWRTLSHFSTNAVCLCLASAPYDESDYLRELSRVPGAGGAVNTVDDCAVLELPRIAAHTAR